jgi:hypothetical protein
MSINNVYFYIASSGPWSVQKIIQVYLSFILKQVHSLQTNSKLRIIIITILKVIINNKFEQYKNTIGYDIMTVQ